MSDDATRIKELLRERVAELAPYLFPNGKRDGNHWCVGDISGAPGQSFKICVAGEKAGLWGDFADSRKHSRSLLDLWMYARDVDFRTALHEAAEWAGHTLQKTNDAGLTRAPSAPGHENSKEPFDWQPCVAAFTDNHLERLAKWRGYSIEFCSWLRERSLVGLYNGYAAFPVHDPAGDVVAAHYRLRDGSWRYHPQGVNVRPLVIGELPPGRAVHVFESQWDALAFMDVFDKRGGIVITRGAGNGAFLSELVRERSSLYGWTQNDPAGNKWLKDICAKTDAVVRRVKIPEQHKDLNEWTRAGATRPDLFSAMMRAELICEAKDLKCNSSGLAEITQLQPFPLRCLPPVCEAMARHVTLPQKPAIELAEVLDSICEFFRRYIVFSSSAQPTVIALWIAHTWALDAFDCTPYLHIRSPEKRCGKTKVLDCVELLVANPWRAVSPSEAVLYRKIELDGPTLLLDEVDTVFSGNKDERKEPLRALLNAGFERKAKVPRCVGQGSNYQVQEFAVFCAKAFAGIGRLPDTISDRCIPIGLIRRSREESIERFRRREAEAATLAIRESLSAWAKEDGQVEKLRASRPDIPNELDDRQADICEPLLAIADLAGRDWPQRCRGCLITLCTSGSDEDESLAIKLLSAIRDVFCARDADRLSTQELLEQLVLQETDAPWPGWWENDLKNGNTRGPAAKLARLLKPFRIHARGIRLPDGTTPRGYLRHDFEQSWTRYCAPPAGKP